MGGFLRRRSVERRRKRRRASRARAGGPRPAASRISNEEIREATDKEKMQTHEAIDNCFNCPDTHTQTHARAHARTHARTHAHTHTHCLHEGANSRGYQKRSRMSEADVQKRAVALLPLLFPLGTSFTLSPPMPTALSHRRAPWRGAWSGSLAACRSPAPARSRRIACCSRGLHCFEWPASVERVPACASSGELLRGRGR